MNWMHTKPDESREIFYSVEYGEKVLSIKVLFESESQAIVEATIKDFDHEKEKGVLQHYDRILVVGIGEDLLDKIARLVHNTKSGLEIIASGVDYEIIRRV